MLSSQAFRRVVMIVALALILIAPAGCRRRHPELVLSAAPWTDGETSRYDMLDRHGNVVGVATRTIRRSAEAWSIGYESKVSRSELVFNTDLRPLRAAWDIGGTRLEASYSATNVTVKTTGDDGRTYANSFEWPPDAIDIEAATTILRAAPFQPGYAVSYKAFPTAGSCIAIPATFEVVG